MKACYKINLSSREKSKCGKTPWQIFKALKRSLVERFGAEAVEQSVKAGDDPYTYLTVR